MAESISIVMKMNEDISNKLKTISSTSQGCSKELEELARKSQQLSARYTDLNKKAAETSAEAMSVKRAMDEAARAFRKSGDEADRLTFERLKEQYNDLTISAKGYSDAAKDTVKDIRSLSDEVRKLENQDIGTPGAEDAGGGSGGLMSSLFGGDVGGKLAQSGIYSMVGGAFSNAISALAESALGQPLASLGSSIVSGAASGAAAGALLGPLGSLAGAGIGAATGLLNGGTEIFAARDDAFKTYYGDLYESTGSATEERLSAGASVSAGRENDLRALTSLLGGDQKAAEDYQAAMVEVGRTPPFSYDTAVSLSREMLGLGLSAQEAMDRINGLADTAAALALSDSNVKSIVSFLESAQLSGTLDARVVKSLSKMGINVYGALADEFGIDESQVLGQLKDLDAERGVEAIYEYMKTSFPDAANSLSDSFDGLSGILDSWKESISAAGGDAYNDSRKDALEADVAAYSGALGEKLAELSAVTGRVEAYGENLKDQFQREALSAVLLGELDKEKTVFSEEDAAKLEAMAAEFSEAEEAYKNGNMEAGQKMTDLRERAEALATAAYESSDWMQTLHEAELDQIAATRELTAGMAATTNALEKNYELGRGLAATASLLENVSSTMAASSPYARAEIKSTDDSNMRKLKSLGLYAYGLDYVPFDEFPALLHQGERVLTAAEAREMDRGVLPGTEALGSAQEPLRDWAEGTFAFGLRSAPYDGFPALLHQGERVQAPGAERGGTNVSVQVGEMTVRQESDIDAIAEALARKLQTAAVRGGF